MDDQRIGGVIRALRRRRGWRQSDLGAAARCGQTTVSLVERGHLDKVSVTTVRAIAHALDATLSMELRWRGAAVDRLLDDAHATLTARLVKTLDKLGWVVKVEVTYSVFGERGSFDVLAWHERTRTLLVIEVKTDLPSAEATVRKLDEKTRLARRVAHDQLGWNANDVGRLLVMDDASTLRRRVERHSTYFGTVLPHRGFAVRSWLREPVGAIAGLWFLSSKDQIAGIQKQSGRDRIRRRELASPSDAVASRRENRRDQALYEVVPRGDFG